MNIEAKVFYHGITDNYDISDHIGFILAFCENPNKFKQAPRNAVYKKHLSDCDDFLDKYFWVSRLVLDENLPQLRLYKA